MPNGVVEKETFVEVRPCVLVAHEPDNYQETLAAVLPDLRPRLRVHLVDPANLDAAAEQLRPRLVVCSRLTAAIRAHAAAWIVLYPDDEDRAEVGVGGEQRELVQPTPTDLLAAIDAATDGDNPGLASA